MRHDAPIGQKFPVGGGGDLIVSTTNRENKNHASHWIHAGSDRAQQCSDPLLAQQYQGGSFVTLRLKSSIYDRFQAPGAGRLRPVRYISGAVFNANPPTLKRLPGVFVRNERAVLPLEIDGLGQVVTLVPVAAILVASLRLHGLDEALNSGYDGPTRIPCRVDFERGEELGYFEHGSTIIVLARGRLRLYEGLETGQIIRMGQPLLQRA